MMQKFRSQIEILTLYKQKISLCEINNQKLKRDKKFLSIARLSAVFGLLAFSRYFWPSFLLTITSVLLFALVFTFLVFRDEDKSTAIANNERLILVNMRELDAMQHNFQKYDDGQIFSDPAHAYASDLDLFGPYSLFQWISRCHADQSKELLAENLKIPQEVAGIKEKQEAARELSEKTEYCQQFQSTAMANPLSINTEERIKELQLQPDGGFENPYWKWISVIYPFIPGAILLLYILDYLSAAYLIYFYLGFCAVSYFISRKITPVFALVSRIQPEMDTLYKQLYQIEGGNFKSSFFQSLQQKLKPAGFDSASSSIAVLNGILKRFDFRLNLLINLIVNPLLLWDLHQILSLNEWKRKTRTQLHPWIEVIAEMELCISLASLVHNEPDWSFPVVDENYFHFTAAGIGHPLIPPDKRVTNDFSMEGTGKIALVTGSNMAGKSTFLRSLGINIVLAQMGAPVCAQRMNMSSMKLVSSMRVADNLAENTSTFYAELKKLQFIIEAVNRKERVLILLDEVLRGTNSTDRHKGSQALVRQLLKSHAVALIATHDTELAHSEAADGSVSNYHFEGRIQEGELYFDYKIKNGICESLNATTLMKKIGIHFED
jgi:hypothetical protein